MNKELYLVIDEMKKLSKFAKYSKYDTEAKVHTRFYNQYEAKVLIEYLEYLETENISLRKTLNEIREVINGEQFFLLMNSQPSKDKAVCEDYFKGKELISKIIDKVGGNK